MSDQSLKTSTPSALFGMFSTELNAKILKFRREELEEGHLEVSENFLTLPHLMIAWSPDFDFRNSDALQHVIGTRIKTGFTIPVEKIDFAGEDIAIYFDKEPHRLIIIELGEQLDSFGMDLVFTPMIKLLKTPIVKGSEQIILERIRQIIPSEILITKLGFGGNKLREEDLEWTLEMPHDRVLEQFLKFRKFNH